MRSECVRASSSGDVELSHLINLSWCEQGTHRSRFTAGPWGCGAAAWRVPGLCRCAAGGTRQGPCAQLSGCVNPFQTLRGPTGAGFICSNPYTWCRQPGSVCNWRRENSPLPEQDLRIPWAAKGIQQQALRRTLPGPRKTKIHPRQPHSSFLFWFCPPSLTTIPEDISHMSPASWEGPVWRDWRG